MIEQLTDLPAGVIGFAAKGKIEADDYRNTLMPAVEKAAADGEVRMVLGEMKRFTVAEQSDAVAWAAA